MIDYIVKNGEDKHCQTIILLMTDGSPNKGESDYDVLLKNIDKKINENLKYLNNLSIHTISVTKEGNFSYMTELACR